MYTNIADNELVQYHQKIRSNVSYTLTEILSNNTLFKVTSMDDVHKAIPLFNCERIESSNTEDIVLGTNKGIICLDDENTIIKFITTTQFRDFNIATNTISKWGKSICYGIVYDVDNKTPLNNAEVNMSIIKNSNVVNNTLLKTNGNGEFVQFIVESYDKISITVKYENIIHTYEV